VLTPQPVPFRPHADGHLRDFLPVAVEATVEALVRRLKDYSFIDHI